MNEYTQATQPLTCQGCRHNLPGDCAMRHEVDGWPRFPEGDCYAPTGDRCELAE